MRKKGKFAWFLELVSGALVLLGISSSAFASQIVIDGSTTLLPFVQAAAEAFMVENPDVRIVVSGGGTGNGIKALLDGTTQIADASREMKPSEWAEARSRGIKPQAHVVAYDCVVPIVHPQNPVSNLTLDQLKRIYTGRISRWNQVGGFYRPIAVIGRDTSSGTFEVWEEKILNKELVTPRSLVAASSGAMIQTVSTNPLAIGYDSLGYVDRSVKALKINGIAASAQTARSGTFPTARKLLMYTNGTPLGDVKRFIDYLVGPEGQVFVKKAGFIPLR